MAKKGELPDLIFVSPIGNGRRKMRMVHALFTVEEWYSDGTPKKLTLRRNDEVLDMQKASDSGTEFMTAYIPEVMTEPHPEKANKTVSEPI